MKTKGTAPVEILRRFDIFSGCDDRLLKKLSNLGTPVRIENGGALTREGKQGREFYLIVEGDADVRHEGATIATLGAGGFFGEMALIDGLPRSADVVATSPMELLVFDPREFAALVRRFEIRSTVLPPTAIAMLNDDDAVTDLAPLRYVRSITAPLSPRQARRFTERFDVFVLNSYGQAELGEVIGWTAADAKAFPEKVGAAGRPHAGVEIKVVGDDGGSLPAGTAGRLHVRPPNRAVGYADGSDLSERVDADGYVDTGDIAHVDTDGFVWIEGRAGDVINRGGNKIFPGDVEEVLRLSPAVRDAAVVGVPDSRLGEVPVAFFTGRSVGAGDLERLCRDNLVPYKVPVAFHHVGELPRNEAGKVVRADLVSRVSSAEG